MGNALGGDPREWHALSLRPRNNGSTEAISVVPKVACRYADFFRRYDSAAERLISAIARNGVIMIAGREQFELGMVSYRVDIE